MIGFTCDTCQTLFASIADCYTITPENDPTGTWIGLTADDNSQTLLSTFVTNATNYVSTLDIVTAQIVADTSACTDPTGEYVLGRMGDSDHEPFWDAGFPALLINDSGSFRNTNHHQTTDTSDSLDFAFMTKVVQATLATTLDLSGPFTYRPQYEIGDATAMLDAAFYAGEASDGSNAAGRMAFQGFTNADVSQAAFWAANLATFQSAIFLVDVGDPTSWTRLSSDVSSLPDRPIYWLPDGSGVISR